MKHLKNVNDQRDASGTLTRTYWITSGPLGGIVEWDADIVEARKTTAMQWLKLLPIVYKS